MHIRLAGFTEHPSYALILRGLATINPLSTDIYSIGQKKGIMAKKCMVFQRFLAVVYSVAIDV